MAIWNGSKKTVVLVPALLLLATSAWGHGAWLEKRQEDIVVVYGHGPGDDTYAPEKVKQTTAYNAQGKALESGVKETKGGYVPLEIAKGTAIVTVNFDNGYWCKDADGKWHNLPKTKVENAKQGSRYVKNGLAILDHFDVLPETFDIPLVILPQRDPLKLKSGDALRIQVMFKGKPLADANIIGDYVNQDSMVSAVTDENGFAMIKVRNQGLNVIATSAEEKFKNNPDADKLSIMGTLSFTLVSGGH
jgi:uncharacterized GH25 family protein